MEKYSYRGCLVSITHMVDTGGLWKGEAWVTTGLQSNITEEHKVFIDVAASSEKMSYLMADRTCNSWVDEYFQGQ